MFTFPCESDDYAVWHNPDDLTQVWSQQDQTYVNLADYPYFYYSIYTPQSYGVVYQMELPVPDETRDYLIRIYKSSASDFDSPFSLLTIGPAGATQGIAPAA